jgi:hypothetical protein
MMAKKSKVAAPTAAGLGNASEITFEYIKSNLFRVIHADGAIGSVTPSGNLHIAFFSERPALPRLMVHKRDSAGTLGPPVPERTEVRAGVIREMDVDVVLSPIATDALINWLTSQKKALTDLRARRTRIAAKSAKRLKLK